MLTSLPDRPLSKEEADTLSDGDSIRDLERLFSILKDETEEIEFRVQGWNRVGIHVFLLLIGRVITGLAKYQMNPEANL